MTTEADQVLPADLMRLYALIGSIASCWSHIEQSVDVTVWWLANIDSREGACITAQIQSLHYKVLALIALLDLRCASKPLIRAVNQFSGKADEVAKRRNRAVHDPISAADGEEPLAVTITAERKLKYGFFDGKMAEYDETENQVSSLLETYIELDQRIRREFEERSRLPFGSSHESETPGREK